jgi:WD40 repeat protein
MRLYYEDAYDILFSSGQDKIVILWNLCKGQIIFRTPAVQSSIYSFTCGMIKKMKYFFFGESNYNINVWNIEELKQVRIQKLDDAVFFLKVMNVDDKKTQ